MLGLSAYHKTFLSCFPVLYVLLCQARSPRKVPCMSSLTNPPRSHQLWSETSWLCKGVGAQGYDGRGIPTPVSPHYTRPTARACYKRPETFITNVFFFFYSYYSVSGKEMPINSVDFHRKSPRAGSPADFLWHLFFKVFRSANNLLSCFLMLQYNWFLLRLIWIWTSSIKLWCIL